jgi:GTPase SAR1 family protein
MLVCFSLNTFGQVAFPLSELNPDFMKQITGMRQITDMKAIGDQLFIGTDKGLWLINNDNKLAVQVVSAEGVIDKFEDTSEIIMPNYHMVWGGEGQFISNLEVINNRLFAITPKGLWVISEEGKHATKIEDIKGNFVIDLTEWNYKSKVVGERLFIITNQGLWMISNNGKHVDKIKSVTEPIERMWTNGEYLFVYQQKDEQVANTRIFDKDGNMITTLKFDNVVDIAVIKEHQFVNTGSDLWVLRLDDKKPVKVEGIDSKLSISDIKPLGEKLFVNTQDNLWIISKEGEHPARAEKLITRRIWDMAVVGEKLFVGTDQGLEIVSKETKNLSKIEGITSDVYNIKVIGEQIFVVSNKCLWLINKDGTQANRVNSLKNISEETVIFHDQIYYFFTPPGDLLPIGYRIDRKYKIHTQPSPTGWWATIIAYVLPSNWLPTEKVQASACYSDLDEKCDEPYYKTIPKEFRFAIADGDALPPDGKFSTQKDFRYEIDWGKNEVRYWVKDKWDNVFLHTATYYGVPSQYFFVALPFILSVSFVLGCFVLAPKVGFSHSAIMNPWLRNYFSLGSVPLLLSALPALRRHILRRYSDSINKDKEFTEWKERFVCPDEEFLPENFGKKLESERKLLLKGDSGVGKTSFFKHLMAYYVLQDKPNHPAKVFPVYVSLTNYGGSSLEELVYTQLFSYGKITDDELAPMFLEQGGLLIFLDGVNEVQNVSDRRKLSEFVEKFWTSNYICLSSQQSYPEIENIPKVELKAFIPAKVREFIRQRVDDKETAERVIKTLTDDDYKLYSVPRDLEFAVEILNGGLQSVPKSRTELYKIIFSSIFARWKESGNAYAEDVLCEHAYAMIVQRDLAFDSVDNPKFKEIAEDLFKQKFLVKREGSYNFRHDLIRAYLASEFFYPRWKNLFDEITGKAVDSNWLEMLKFSCENIEDSVEVKNLVYEVLNKSVRKDVVKDLFEWLKSNHPSKCKIWEKDFFAKYGELDFK